jgi:nucleoside-diphosphate-sugar epimerase
VQGTIVQAIALTTHGKRAQFRHRRRRELWIQAASMNLFIAGGTGAIGRVLVPLLVNAGHKVVALTRSADRTSQLAQMGAVPVVGDVYDEAQLARLVAESEAELVMHQLTAFGTRNGDPYAETIRVRIEGTRCLLSAARAARVRRFIAQSISLSVRRPAAD